jgi:acetone carboxylase gamma subunit
MSGKDRISASVAVSDGQAVCAGCGHDLGPADAGWKANAAMREVPIAVAGGPAFDTGHDGVVLRHFYCRGCGALLDTETATPADPVLNDRLVHRA